MAFQRLLCFCCTPQYKSFSLRQSPYCKDSHQVIFTLEDFLQFIEEQMIPLIYLISSDLCEKARTGLFYFLFSDLRCKDIWVLLEISIIVIPLFSSRCCPLSLAWWKITALMLSAWILLFMWIWTLWRKCNKCLGDVEMWHLLSLGRNVWLWTASFRGTQWKSPSNRLLLVECA